MSAIFTFLEGKKSYLVAFAGAAIGLAQAIYPELVIPPWVWWVLSAAGLGAIRAAIK